MADSSSHKMSSPKITPKEEPVTLDKLERPNPFLPADQVEFIFEEISFTTNSEVALLYPSHPNTDYFREVSDFISKCCLKEAFIRAPTQYKEYLSEFLYTAKTLDDFKIWISTPTRGIRGEICINTFRNALRIITYLTQVKATDGSSHLVFRWENRLRRKQSLKHIFESKTKASKSKTGQSEKGTQSSSAKDKIPSYHLPPTLVVGEMHKETQQAAGGPTSLGATSKDGAHPQLSSGHDASLDSIAEADPRLSTSNDSIPSQQGTDKESRADEISKKIKLEDLSDLLKDTRSTFFTHDSPQDEPNIISNESEEEEEVAKDKDSHASSQFQLLHSQKDELEQQKENVIAEVASLKARFATVAKNALEATTKDVPSAGQATASPTNGEKNTTKDAKTNLQNELADLLCINVLEQYHNKKLLLDRYCDKMLKRRISSKTINCNVITQKGPISLKVYREDETIKVIANFKVSDLHLAD
nr:hypothetical protein [Tanacetum cinerariifolium]